MFSTFTWRKHASPTISLTFQLKIKHERVLVLPSVLSVYFSRFVIFTDRILEQQKLSQPFLLDNPALFCQIRLHWHPCSTTGLAPIQMNETDALFTKSLNWYYCKITVYNYALYVSFVSLSFCVNFFYNRDVIVHKIYFWYISWFYVHSLVCYLTAKNFFYLFGKLLTLKSVSKATNL